MSLFFQVVAVNILVLEKNIDHVNFQFEIPRRPPLVKIPLAGFMLGKFSYLLGNINIL